MPTFEFNTGGSTVEDSNTGDVSISFTDNSVQFTLSTTGNGGFNAVSNSTGSGGPGQITMTDLSSPGPFTLDVNPTQASNDFGAVGANISMQIGSSTVIGTWNVTFVHTSDVAQNEQFTNVTAGQNLSFGTTENYELIRFTPTSAGATITIDSLTASITCYLTGTRIATPTGSVPVETLQPGDQILTADGGTTTVNWLGIQPIDTTTATPAKANPICFVAGSLGPNVPARDLFVSPDHAMDIDGFLYNATALVNGRSIYQVAQMPLEGFTYYHIDTGTHELILAEGAASETYLDVVGRDAFINGHEAEDAAIIPEMTVPRIVARRMVPKDVAEALSARADSLGLTPARKVA